MRRATRPAGLCPPPAIGQSVVGVYGATLSGAWSVSFAIAGARPYLAALERK